MLQMTTSEKLVAAGIVMQCRMDDARAILADDAAEAALIVASVENGELWQTTTEEWHHSGRRNFHATPTEAWREPTWSKTRNKPVLPEMLRMTTSEKLVAAGIVMHCRMDDCQRILCENATEAERIVASIESGELRHGPRGWSRKVRDNFHATPTLAWREPPSDTTPAWSETKAAWSETKAARSDTDASMA